MSTIISDSSEVGPWLVRQFRLTAFPMDPASALKEEWWSRLAGSPREVITRKSLLLTEEGRWGAGSENLVVSVDPLCIQLTLVPIVEPLDIPTAIPTIGNFSSVVDKSADLVRRFLKDLCPAINRLAFGVVLVQPVASKEAGHKKLQTYLSDVKLSSESSDFVYRINKPRGLACIPQTFVNRLMTWTFISMAVRVQVSRENVSAISHDSPPSFACMLDLDINTAPDHEDQLPRELLPGIWDELIQLGIEISEKGDVS